MEGDVFAGGVRRGSYEGVHVRFRDEFYGDGDVVFPCAEGLVVGGCDEAAVLIDESYSIYGPEMVVVFLRHFAGASVELHDFLVGHAG